MSQHVLLREIESANRRKDIPDFRSGDSVRVHTLIKEGDKERVQVFEGVVIGQHRGGSRATFTVRKISYGVGVERIFPLHTSRIEKIEIVTKGHVRRARLNYLRDLKGKAARIKGEKTDKSDKDVAASSAGAAAAAAAPVVRGRRRRRRRSRRRDDRVVATTLARMGSDRLAARPGTGRRAEELAAAFLERAGLRVVARNWRRPEGELDLVADDAGACVFVEVRSRTGEAQGHPLESITPRKQAQVIRAARLYLAEAAPQAAGYRFDVVAVTFDPTGRAEPDVLHIPNAFETG